MLSKEPEKLTALRLLGVTLHKMGESDAAIIHLRAATELAPEIQSPWWDLAVVLRDVGQTEQAQAALVRAPGGATKPRRRSGSTAGIRPWTAWC